MREINRRITRIESGLPGRAAAVADQPGVDRLADFVGNYNDVTNHLRRELAERGQQAALRRVRNGGCELERLAHLTTLGQCPHTFMLLVALEGGDPANELLAWWRDASTLILRRLLGEPIGPAEPFVFRPPEFVGVTDDRRASQAFDECRKSLERRQPARA